MKAQNCDNVVIETGQAIIIIIAENNEGKQVIVQEDEIKWKVNSRKHNTGIHIKHLKLKEISNQLTALGYRAVFSVWRETEEEGVIYQFGNYPEYPNWEKHGETKGYA